MKFSPIHYCLLIIICLCTGCANITAPPGGKKDKIPPKLVSVDPADSILNTKVKKIVLHFDEYIVISDVTKEVQISPILTIQPNVTSKYKTVTIKLADSLLEDNTTYRISFGKAIKDLHENNIFANYFYMFSTGAYFDSLELHGKVTNAGTGLPDTGSVVAVLYSASKLDSAVVREKPKYITPVQADGTFVFKGLPDKKFRIYALKDYNGNLIYDGGDERIGFTENVVRPGDTAMPPINLRIFKEIDTLSKKDTSLVKPILPALSSKKSDAKPSLSYFVNADTSNPGKRTVEITKPLEVTFSRPLASILDTKITLAYDSSGTEIKTTVTAIQDTARKKVIILNTYWRENTLYTLRMLKGFAKDTGGLEAMPSRYIFRTKREDDYGKLEIHLPTKYWAKKFLLMVNNEKDTVYYKPVTDTLVYLTKLQPGKYSMRIVIDENGDLKWTTGDLFHKVQPEIVVPHENVINLKPGWEIVEDFEQPVKPVKPANPKTRASAAEIKPK